ncbi:MAG: glutamate-5-semialdehyde dehydrogenase [Candidatus Fimenecus sp.]
MNETEKLCEKAKLVSRELASATDESIKNALYHISNALIEDTDIILEENAKDLLNAEQNGITSVMSDRLRLTVDRIKDMANGVVQVAELPSPLSKVIAEWVLPNGLEIKKVSVPIGTVGIIFESRPNVTSDIAAICLKTGNAVVLRGGKESINSNKAIYSAIIKGLEKSDLPINSVQLITDTNRRSADELMRASKYVDVLIPRGSAELIEAVAEKSNIPVIKTGTGNCHIYVDEFADIEKAVKVIVNAKTQRPSVCNACESLLINKKIAEKALPKISDVLFEKGVKLFGDENTRKIVENADLAEEEEFGKEFLDLIISCKIVENIDEAIAHINKYGTLHSECIITENAANAAKFMKMVDASTVYQNASTRFTDGGQFGFGAEMGISTGKLHARGPVGLSEMTSYKYLVFGNGQIRE